MVMVKYLWKRSGGVLPGLFVLFFLLFNSSFTLMRLREGWAGASYSHEMWYVMFSFSFGELLLCLKVFLALNCPSGSLLLFRKAVEVVPASLGLHVQG